MRTHAHIHARMYACTRTHVHKYVYTHVHVHTLTYAYRHARAHTRTQTRMRARAHTQTHAGPSRLGESACTDAGYDPRAAAAAIHVGSEHDVLPGEAHAQRKCLPLAEGKFRDIACFSMLW